MGNLWIEYAQGKQTYAQLGQKYGRSKRSIQTMLDSYKGIAIAAISPLEYERNVVLGMDATYWGRSFGVMLFRDLHRHQNLFWKYIKNETVCDYLNGIELLKKAGWNIVGVVGDGKIGLLNAIDTIPVQLCQYHEYKTVIRYITKTPTLLAGKELKSIMDLMFHTDKESFVGLFTEWKCKWEKFMNEKTFSSVSKRKWSYTHNRIRSAYRSIERHQHYLFTWYDYPNLNIPSTNNSVEGTCSNLKNKLANHNGLKRKRKIKLINHLFKK